MTTEDSPVVTLTAIRARVAALQEQLEELHRKVKRVLALKSVIEHSFQTDGSRLQDVRAHYAGLSEALTKIANGDRRESEVLSLVRQAFTQCDAISAISWAPDFFVCPLLTLPEPCITSYIGPFLGTQSIVGSLSRTHTSLHALSHNPAIHTNMHLQTDEYPGIVITKQQIAAWGTALSKVTRATVLCWPTSAVLELLERASNVLEELYASEPWETPSHLAAPLADRGLREDRIVFPKLIRAEVAGEWITVAHRRNWEPTAPKDLSVRRVESWSHVVGTGAWLAGPGPHSLTLKARFAHGVEFDMVRNLLWTRFRRLVGVGVDLKLHRREAIRNPPLTADMTLAGVPYGDPRSADIRRLSAYAKTPFQQRTGEAMQLEELGVVVNEIHDTMLAAVQVLRSRQLAPRGKVTFDVMPSVEFHTMDILRYLEADPSSADTLTELALCVKSVALPSGLAQGQTVSSAAPYCLPQLVFSRATQLELQGCGAASEPLPAYFLEHICDRHFPRITTLDLGKVEGAREEAARKAVDLPSLREVRFETNRSPLCLRGCQKGLPLVHVKGSYRASGAGVWSLWEGGDEGAEDGHQRGLEKRIRKITITVRHPEEEPEGALPGVAQAILPVCLRAIDRCPFLDCITISHPHRQLSPLVPESARKELQSRGFVAVRTLNIWMLCRVRDCVAHGTQRTTEVSVCAVLMPRMALDDSVSLKEEGLLQVHPLAARYLEPEMREELTEFVSDIYRNRWNRRRWWRNLRDGLVGVDGLRDAGLAGQ